MLGIIGSIFPVVGRIVRAANEAQEALKAGQDFAAEVEKTLEGDHPLRDKATSMVKEFQEAETAINEVLGRA